jgi:hypothetical protein
MNPKNVDMSRHGNGGVDGAVRPIVETAVVAGKAAASACAGAAN